MSDRAIPERVLPRLKLKFKEAEVIGNRPPWPNFPVPVNVAYTEDEKPCPFILMVGHKQTEAISKRVTNLNLMKLDAMKSKAAINFVSSMASKEQYDEKFEFAMKTFFDASILWYSKLFIESDKGKIKLDYKKVYKDKANYIKLHEKIIDIRHKSLAHQTGNYDHALAFVALNPDFSKKEIVEFYYKYFFFGLLNNEDMATFEEMINVLIGAIDKKIYDAEDRMLKELTKNSVSTNCMN